MLRERITTVCLQSHVATRDGHAWLLRAGLVLLLGLGWAWQEHRHLQVVEVYFTTPAAKPGLAVAQSSYAQGTPSVCLYLVYADAQAGKDTYSYTFAHATHTFFRDVAHAVATTHGAALDCFDTGGELAPGSYTATVVLDGRDERTLPFSVGLPRRNP
jgi:hypothetical protein